MGYRANVITRDREYGSQTFCSYEEFVEDFIPNSSLEIQSNDNQDFFEVDKAELQTYVDSIPDDEEESDYPSYTNKELKEELQDAIKESKGSWVSWEWF